jgi:hypothetical protein
MRLDPEDIDAIARAVAEQLRDQAPAPSARLVDAGELAAVLGVKRTWVYAHAKQLDAIRLGGPRGHMRFDLDAVQRRLTAEPVRRSARAVKPRTTQLMQLGGELLPIDP